MSLDEAQQNNSTQEANAEETSLLDVIFNVEIVGLKEQFCCYFTINVFENFT